MEREIIEEGASVAEAIDAALERLGVQQDAVEYEVLDEGGRRILGGARPARVRVWLRNQAAVPGFAQAGVFGEMSGETMGAEEALGAEDDDELDVIADSASEIITEILARLGMRVDIDEYEGDDGEIILDLVGHEDLGVLIGRHGRTLDALQVLVTAMLNRKSGIRHPVMVDVSGYRYRQRTKIEELAKRAADRAARTGRAVTLRPMTAFERKVVHMCLRDDRRVETISEGDEPARQVVISPKRA